MTNTTSTGRSSQFMDTPEVTGWAGWVVFAGTMMLILGAFHAIQGLVALLNDQYYLVGANGLTVQLDYTTWGWVHLIGGVLVILAGAGLFAGQTWARGVGIVLAVVSAITNFAFIAAYPVWSSIVIALDILIVYALAVHGRELRSS
jgi:hypothetical protein